MILVDTSVLVDSLGGSGRSLPHLLSAVSRGDRLMWCSPVAYEWLRGPRTSEELHDQERLFPLESALPFETEEAQIAARIYQSMQRPRAREADIAIAAIAIRHKARLWTL